MLGHQNTTTSNTPWKAVTSYKREGKRFVKPDWVLRVVVDFCSVVMADANRELRSSAVEHRCCQEKW